MGTAATREGGSPAHRIEPPAHGLAAMLRHQRERCGGVGVDVLADGRLCWTCGHCGSWETGDWHATATAPRTARTAPAFRAEPVRPQAGTAARRWSPAEHGAWCAQNIPDEDGHGLQRLAERYNCPIYVLAPHVFATRRRREGHPDTWRAWVDSDGHRPIEITIDASLRGDFAQVLAHELGHVACIVEAGDFSEEGAWGWARAWGRERGEPWAFR
jgi:hypothetical protein